MAKIALLTLVLLIPSASAVDLYLGHGTVSDGLFMSELQEDPREKANMSGRSFIGAAYHAPGTTTFLLGDADPSQVGRRLQG